MMAVARSSAGPSPPRSIVADPTVKAIAATHNKSAQQVALRWIVQRGDVLAVAAQTEAAQAADADLWSFALADDEMARLNALKS